MMSKDEFQRFVNEEADIRKEKAEKIMLHHSIDAGAIGVIPGLDLAVQKFVIQKYAMKKIGQIFGLDIDLIEEENSLAHKNADNDNNFTIITPETNFPNSKDKKLSNIVCSNNKNNNNKNDNNENSSYDDNDNKGEGLNFNKNEAFSKAGQYSSSGIGFGFASFITEEAGYISKAGQISGEIATNALKGISMSNLFIGSGIGIGTGFYFTKKHCEELIEKLYNYFKENIRKLSNCLDHQAVQYLILRAKNIFKFDK